MLSSKLVLIRIGKIKRCRTYIVYPDVHVQVHAQWLTDSPLQGVVVSGDKRLLDDIKVFLNYGILLLVRLVTAIWIPSLRMTLKVQGAFLFFGCFLFEVQCDFIWLTHPLHVGVSGDKRLLDECRVVFLYYDQLLLVWSVTAIWSPSLRLTL